MNRRFYIILSFIIVSILGMAQTKVGEWRDHLGYNSCNTVAKVGNIVYASNGAGLLRYNTLDGSVERISKINGLSDIGIELLRYNPYNGTLLIVYNNANIDVLKGDEFINFSDIKRKTLTGKKNINEVTFKNNIAYLACGFGIVVFDTDKIEIKDTYYIGPGGSYLNVHQIQLTDSTIIAATSGGLYRANTSTLLNNFQNWSTINAVPPGTYNGVVKYKNRLIANYSPYAASGIIGKDSLYCYDGVSWKRDTIKKPNPLEGNYTIKKLIVCPNNNYLTLAERNTLEVYNPAESRIVYINQYPMGYSLVSDVYSDFSNPNIITYWIADLAQGFIRSEGPYAFGYPNTKININGTRSNYVSSIDIFDGKLISAPTKIDETGTAHYLKNGLNLFVDDEWSYVKEDVFDSIMDYNYAYIDRKDPSRIWASSWINGLCEYQNGQLVKVYNSVNSVIPALSCCADWHRVAGLSQDQDGNLWIGGSDVQNFLSVRRASDGAMINLSFSSSSLVPYVGRIFADKNNLVWVCLPRSTGLVVIKNNNFTSFDAVLLGTAEGLGKLPDLSVSAVAEDDDGHIWIGTAKGLAVFYNPENIFGGGNFDAQQILITQDGHVQILLETEKVTAIVVDGANRKWIGTEASGIYCFSSDGQKQIYHFTSDNSPLFSNLIHDIAYDEKSGDIFIGTDQGIQSYRTLIVKGEEEFKDVHAYPNPVKPGYVGNVYIRGLMDASVVKITDINGNLIWETKSQGGQIEWGLKNINGQKVAPGVYLASCALSDGSTSAIAKILVLN